MHRVSQQPCVTVWKNTYMTVWYAQVYQLMRLHLSCDSRQPVMMCCIGQLTQHVLMLMLGCLAARWRTCCGRPWFSRRPWIKQSVPACLRSSCPNGISNTRRVFLRGPEQTSLLLPGTCSWNLPCIAWLYPETPPVRKCWTSARFCMPCCLNHCGSCCFYSHMWYKTAVVLLGYSADPMLSIHTTNSCRMFQSLCSISKIESAYAVIHRVCPRALHHITVSSAAICMFRQCGKWSTCHEPAATAHHICSTCHLYRHNPCKTSSKKPITNLGLQTSPCCVPDASHPQGRGGGGGEGESATPPEAVCIVAFPHTVHCDNCGAMS